MKLEIRSEQFKEYVKQRGGIISIGNYFQVKG